MNELEQLREEIDRIDRDMAALFARRMHCVGQVAAYKKEHGLPILDKSREEAVVEKNRARVEEPLQPCYEEFLRRTIDLSRAYQESLLKEE